MGVAVRRLRALALFSWIVAPAPALWSGGARSAKGSAQTHRPEKGIPSSLVGMPSHVLARATNSSDASVTQAAANSTLSGNFSAHVVTTSTALSGNAEYLFCPSLRMYASMSDASSLYASGRLLLFSLRTPLHQLVLRKTFAA